MSLLYSSYSIESLNRLNRRICARVFFSEDMERKQILEFATEQYLKFSEYIRAILVALQLANSELVSKCFTACPGSLMRNQLAFILARVQVTARAICNIVVTF